MPGHDRRTWHVRIKGVEQEFISARAGAGLVLGTLRRDPSAFAPDFGLTEARTMAENLEPTYLIRLFGAFEAGLRTYWATLRPTEPTSRDLIDAIAARRGVPDTTRSSVHDVRIYRNWLVHELQDPTPVVPILTARGYLQKYFSWLPDDW